jgi:hypothetical protein
MLDSLEPSNSRPDGPIQSGCAIVAAGRLSSWIYGRPSGLDRQPSVAMSGLRNAGAGAHLLDLRLLPGQFVQG